MKTLACGNRRFFAARPARNTFNRRQRINIPAAMLTDRGFTFDVFGTVRASTIGAFFNLAHGLGFGGPLIRQAKQNKDHQRCEQG